MGYENLEATPTLEQQFRNREKIELPGGEIE